MQVLFVSSRTWFIWFNAKKPTQILHDAKKSFPSSEIFHFLCLCQSMLLLVIIVICRYELLHLNKRNICKSVNASILAFRPATTTTIFIAPKMTVYSESMKICWKHSSLQSKFPQEHRTNWQWACCSALYPRRNPTLETVISITGDVYVCMGNNTEVHEFYGKNCRRHIFR